MHHPQVATTALELERLSKRALALASRSRAELEFGHVSTTATATFSHTLSLQALRICQALDDGANFGCLAKSDDPGPRPNEKSARDNQQLQRGLQAATKATIRAIDALLDRAESVLEQAEDLDGRTLHHSDLFYK